MRKILVILLSVFLLNSCASQGGLNRMEKLEKLELGMSKKEVLAIMGDKYIVDSVSETPEGKMEVLSFNATYHYPEYLLYFLDGRLKEYHRVVPLPPVPTQDVRVVKDNTK